MLAIIRDSGATLLRLLNDILDFSKIEAGAFQLETAPFRLGEVFDMVEATFRAKATERDLRFTVDFDEPDAVRLGDSHRVTQILNNIVSNAIKFTERGSVTVHASLAQSDRLRIVVRDTGVGMTEDQVARVFDEFAQADSSTTRRFGGSGLGMAITRRLVDMFGGTIDIDSAPGEGTTIDVSIPLRTPALQLRGAAPTPEVASLTGLRALAVDDNAVNRQVLAAMLESLGAEAETVETGVAFLAALEASPRDVVLIDISMPGMDGIEVIKAVRAAAAQAGATPIAALACTASVMPEEVRFYRASGFDGVLAKPISAQTLSEEVGRVLSARRGENAR
jgi:CheY-like chemotaxis protein